MEEVQTASLGSEVYTVSRLVAVTRELLEYHFPLLWVEGEISNLARPSSGHLYFTLKDDKAQVRCAMFRLHNQHLPFMLENGMHVFVRARVSLYGVRGDFQLVIEHLEQAGEGRLRQAFELLKQRLSAQGLFDSVHKKPLPIIPEHIGLITSPTGAALRDFLSCLRRRFPAIPVLIYPIPVQGATAAGKIAQTVHLASSRGECDVLVLTRGGGSLEDLWAFNEEVVARALYECRIPVVTGIGHEIDFTIADFVADRRAPTPTTAAELLAPDTREWQERFARLRERLLLCWRRQSIHRRQRLQALEKRLQYPARRLRDRAQRLDELEQRLYRACRLSLSYARSRVAELHARLERHTPLYRLQHLQGRFRSLWQRLQSGLSSSLERRRGRLVELVRTLEAVSPLATLQRGYAVVQHWPTLTVVRRARELKPGDRIRACLYEGKLICKVEDQSEE